jgi:hypothetical protein
VIVSGLVRFHPDLEPLLRPIDSVQPHPENFNNGDLDQIGDSIDQNGMCDVVLAQTSTGYIISGNHTWMSLKERDAEVCPLVMLDVDDMRAKKIMVAMNAIPRRARPDKHSLLRIVNEIAERDTLRGTGVDSYDREALERLAQMTPNFEKADWPMLMIRVSPQMMKAFRHATREADTDTDRFELLLRLADAL